MTGRRFVVNSARDAPPLGIESKAKIVELFQADGVWRLEHEVEATLILRKGDDLADVLLVGEEHDDSGRSPWRCRRAEAPHIRARQAARRSAWRYPQAE